MGLAIVIVTVDFFEFSNTHMKTKRIITSTTLSYLQPATAKTAGVPSPLAHCKQSQIFDGD